MRLTTIFSTLFLLVFISNNSANAQGLSGGAAGARAANPEFPQLLEWTVQERNQNLEIEGTPYIEEEWNKANILFKSNEIIEDIPVKYDLIENLMEIKTKKTIKVCPPERIIAFELNANEDEVRQFVNCNRFKADYKLIGFYEVLVDNEEGLSLLLKTEASVKESNYNSALDVGEETAKIVKRDSYFIARNKTAYTVPKNKKAFLKLFGAKSSKINLLMKEEKLKVGNEQDLIQVLEYYNSI